MNALKIPGLIAGLKRRSRKLKGELAVLIIAYRSPQVQWYKKLIIVATVAYALSPLDLIPDFIPVLGYLDDLLLVPFGIWLSVKSIPRRQMDEFRAQAKGRALTDARVLGRYGAVFIIAVWLLLLLFITLAVFGKIG